MPAGGSFCSEGYTNFTDANAGSGSGVEIIDPRSLELDRGAWDVPCRHFGIGCAPVPIAPMQAGWRS